MKIHSVRLILEDLSIRCCFDEFVAMIKKKIFDRASNVNNGNLMKFDIRIRVLKHSILVKLGLRD